MFKILKIYVLKIVKILLNLKNILYFEFMILTTIDFNNKIYIILRNKKHDEEGKSKDI